MRLASWSAVLAVGCSAALLAPLEGDAQFGGIYQLPSQNFTWNWGNLPKEGQPTGLPDWDIQGTEAAFRCTLKAKLRFSSQLTSSDIMQIETALRASLQFVYDVSTEMNQLDFQHALDWAQLDCKKPEPGPVDEQKKAEREERAREKTQRDVERLRERARRQAGDSN